MEKSRTEKDRSDFYIRGQVRDSPPLPLNTSDPVRQLTSRGFVAPNSSDKIKYPSPGLSTDRSILSLLLTFSQANMSPK
jgi:hypothetical protein